MVKSRLLHWTFLILLTVPFITAGPKVTYPKVKKEEDAVDVYFEQKVANPFKWLTKADTKSKTTFMTEQSAVTSGYVKQIPTADRKLLEKYVQTYEHESFLHYVPVVKAGENYFTLDEYQNKAFYQAGPKSKGVEILSSKDDPSKRIGARLIISRPSPGGDTLAFSFSTCFEMVCYNPLNFKTVSTSKDLTDVLNNVYSLLNTIYSVAWNTDGTGIYYLSNSTAPADLKQKPAKTKKLYVYYHHLGTKQTDDVLLGEVPHWVILSLKYSDDGQFLVVKYDPSLANMEIHVTPEQATRKNKELAYVYVLELCSSGKSPCKPTSKDKKPKVHKIATGEATFDFLGNVGSTLYFFSFSPEDYATSSILQMELAKPTKKDWTVLKIPQTDFIIEAVLVNGAYIVAVSMTADSHGHRQEKEVVYTIKDKKSTVISLNVLHMHGLTVGRKDTKVTFLAYSILSACEAYVLDVSKSPFKPEKIQLPGTATDPFRDSVLSEMKNYTVGKSSFPMLILHGKDVKQDGTAPLLLLFNSYTVVTSCIKALLVPFMESFNGMVAIAAVDMPPHKPSPLPPTEESIESAIAAMEFVSKSKYTDKSKLTVVPGNDGFASLVGVLLNKRPDLFGAALLINPSAPTVGVFDVDAETMKWVMEHYSKKLDLSSFYKTKEVMTELVKISAYNNIKPIKTEFPAVLLIDIGTEDALRYIAQLQSVLGSNAKQVKPLLGKFSVAKVDSSKFVEDSWVEQYSDILSFLALSMDYKVIKR